MRKAQLPSAIQCLTYCQMRSGKRPLGPTRLRRVGVFGINFVCEYMNATMEKAEW
jgi:hypothetical protein